MGIQEGMEKENMAKAIKLRGEATAMDMAKAMDMATAMDIATVMDMAKSLVGTNLKAVEVGMAATTSRTRR